MMFRQMGARRCSKLLVALLIGGAFQLGLVESCDDRLIGLTRVFDPCGTILGSCLPGQFESDAASIGDRCVDPGCVIPGGCRTDENPVPLGTQRDLPGC